MNRKNYPHQVTVNNKDGTINLAVFDWLEDNIGEYYADWNYTGFDFMFKNEKDAIHFALRWA